MPLLIVYVCRVQGSVDVYPLRRLGVRQDGGNPICDKGLESGAFAVQVFQHGCAVHPKSGILKL